MEKTKEKTLVTSLEIELPKKEKCAEDQLIDALNTARKCLSGIEIVLREFLDAEQAIVDYNGPDLTALKEIIGYGK